MPYRRVAAVPGAVRLLGSSVVARLPLGTSTIALLLFMHDVAGSFAAAGAVVAAFTVTGAIAAPVQGRLVDAAGAAPVLVACALGHAAGLAAFPLAADRAPVAALIVLAAVSGALLPPISSCARAVWPEVAPDGPTRDAGYALDAVAQELIWICGPLLVAVCVAAADPALAVLLSAGLTLAGTLVFAAAPLVRAHGRHGRASRAPVLRAPGMARVLGCTAVMGFGLGASEIAFPAAAVDLGRPALGPVLLALMSVASLATGLAYGARARRSASLETRHGALLLVLAACTLPMAAAQDLGTALAFSLVAGAAWSPVLACQYALVAELAPPGAVTTAFAWSTSSVVCGLALGTALAGLLVEASSAAAGFLLAAAAYGAGGALALTPRRSPPVVA
jgi:MFS family permease